MPSFESMKRLESMILAGSTAKPHRSLTEGYDPRTADNAFGEVSKLFSQAQKGYMGIHKNLMAKVNEFQAMANLAGDKKLTSDVNAARDKILTISKLISEVDPILTSIHKALMSHAVQGGMREEDEELE